MPEGDIPGWVAGASDHVKAGSGVEGGVDPTWSFNAIAECQLLDPGFTAYCRYRQRWAGTADIVRLCVSVGSLCLPIQLTLRFDGSWAVVNPHIDTVAGFSCGMAFEFIARADDLLESR